MDTSELFELCPPPDPKTQPKITEFFQPIEESPKPTRIRKRALPGTSSSSVKDKETTAGNTPVADETEQPPAKRKAGHTKAASAAKMSTPKKRGRPRKTTSPQNSNSNEMIPTVPGIDEVASDILVEETTVLTTQSPKDHTEESPASKKRRTFTVEKKQEVVEYAKQHSLYKASLHYKLSCGTIGPWMKKDFSEMGPTAVRASGSGRKLSYPPRFESELAQWILEQRDLNPHITTQEIIDYACNLIQPTCQAFKGTRGWYQKFLGRNSLLCPDSEPLSKKLPAPLEAKIKEFLGSIREKRSDYDYPMELIGNMDEVPVQIDMASNRKNDRSRTMVFKTYTVGGEKQSYTVGAEKQHITVVLTACASGKLLPPMVIFRGVKAPKNTSIPSDWHVCAQVNGIFDDDLMKVWMNEIWLKHTQGRKALLVMDSSHPELTVDYKSTLTEANTTVCQIPLGCSSKLQPVTTSLATPFRVTCETFCSEFYKSKIQSLTHTGDKLRSASKEDICPWLVSAYSNLVKRPSMIATSFKATGLSLALDNSEESLYRVDSEEEDFQQVEAVEKKEEQKAEPVEIAPDQNVVPEDMVFAELDNSLKNMYSYLLQMQNKSLSEAELQLLEQQLQPKSC